MAKPNGPLAYSKLIKQSPNVVTGNPLIYAFLVDAMHQTIEKWYANREEQYQAQKAAELEGNYHFIQPELMKRTIEDCHQLLNIAKDVADGKHSAVKADYYTLLKEYKANPKH
jgi:pantothenate kinase